MLLRELRLYYITSILPYFYIQENTPCLLLKAPFDTPLVYGMPHNIFLPILQAKNAWTHRIEYYDTHTYVLGVENRNALHNNLRMNYPFINHGNKAII